MSRGKWMDVSLSPPILGGTTSPHQFCLCQLCFWNSKWLFYWRKKCPAQGEESFQSSNTLGRECQWTQALKLLISIFCLFFQKTLLTPCSQTPLPLTGGKGLRILKFVSFVLLWWVSLYSEWKKKKKSRNTPARQTMLNTFKALLPNYSLRVWFKWLAKVMKDHDPVKISLVKLNRKESISRCVSETHKTHR
jgi:hypothetical protein